MSRSGNLSTIPNSSGLNYTTLSGPAGRTFDPGTGNRSTVTFPAAPARYVRLLVTANTGWPAGQLSGLEVHAA